MAWLQTDLDAIEAAISTGAKRVRYQTHEVEYHSVADMLKVRDLIKGELQPDSVRTGAMFANYESDY